MKHPVFFLLFFFSFGLIQAYDLTEFKAPDFREKPFHNEAMHKRIKPFLLPSHHPIKPALDAIFSQSRVTTSPDAMRKAGFITVFKSNTSKIRLAKHPEIPGYLFKFYLDTDTKKSRKKAPWELLADRCEGARNIRNLIKEKKLRHFVVPDKWLYPLPISEGNVDGSRLQPVVLVTVDMELAPREKCLEAWKSASRVQLQELYCLLSHGYASTFLVMNIPYTIHGKFACVDTEYPKRVLKYPNARPYFSEEMQLYWDELTSTNTSR